MNRTIATRIALIAAIVGSLVSGAAIGSAQATATARHADITVEPCTYYATHTAAPAYTFAGACIDASGSLVPVHSR